MVNFIANLANLVNRKYKFDMTIPVFDVAAQRYLPQSSCSVLIFYKLSVFVKIITNYR